MSAPDALPSTVPPTPAGQAGGPPPASAGSATPPAGAAASVRSPGAEALDRAREALRARGGPQSGSLRTTDSSTTEPSAVPGTAGPAPATGGQAGPAGEAGAAQTAHGGDGAAAADGTAGAVAGGDGLAVKEEAPRSTLKAPEDWPAEWKARFTGLPNDDARATLLDAYKSMQGGFTRATQRLSQQAQELASRYGDAERVQRTMDLAAAFDRDPRATLAHLAQQAGIPLYFEPPAGAQEEIPEFASATEALAWMTKRAKDAALAELRKQNDQERSASEAAATHARTVENLRASLKAMEDPQKYPDWGHLRESTLALMRQSLDGDGGLTVEQAYQLTRYPGLVKLAQEGHAAKAEAQKLRKELDALKAGRTAPPGGYPGSGAGRDLSQLSPGAAALAKAQANLAARRGNGT